MTISLLKSKLHRATITQCSIHYEGSITIDRNLMAIAGFFPYEKVLVSNINQGTRLETYVIPGKAKTGVIGLNGAAARLGKKGDKITIMSFSQTPLKDAAKTKPKIVVLGKNNSIQKNKLIYPIAV